MSVFCYKLKNNTALICQFDFVLFLFVEKRYKISSGCVKMNRFVLWM